MGKHLLSAYYVPSTVSNSEIQWLILHAPFTDSLYMHGTELGSVYASQTATFLDSGTT